MFRHPYVIAPNMNIARSICNMLHIPKKYALAANPNNLMGFSKDMCFIIYDEPNLYRTEVWNQMHLTLDVGNYTIIYMPELIRVNR